MPSNPRSILALVTEAYGGRGGIAQYNRDLLAALAGAADPMTISILPRLAPDPFEGLPAGISQRAPRLGKIGYAVEAFRVAWASRPAILFCGHLHMAPLCALIAQAIGAKLVIQLHGIEIWSRPTLAQRSALEAASLVLCVSRYTRSEVLRHASIPPHRVRVQANTYGDEFTPGDREAARRRFEIPEGSICILSIGRLDSRERYKGQDRVIAALPKLLTSHPSIVYLVGGMGDDLDRLQALARQKGVIDRVRFLGHVPRDLLPDLYRAADLFTLPSTGEGFGIVFLEAMACGTPALGLGMAGALDALAGGGLGLAPSEEDLEEALASAVASHKRDEAALVEAVNARFGRASFAAQAAAVFESIGG